MGGYPACSLAATEQEAGFTVDRCMSHLRNHASYWQNPKSSISVPYAWKSIPSVMYWCFRSIYFTLSDTELKKKTQKKKIKQTNLHFLFESHDPHHMRTLHKNSGGRGFPSGHARDGCLRTGTKLLIPDFPGSHVPLNASFHAYTEHNKVFLFYSFQSSCPFFF